MTPNAHPPGSPPAMAISPARPSGLPLRWKVVLFGLAFWAGAEAGRFLSAPDGTYVSFWLPAGLYVSALLLNENRTWPWFMLAALAGNLVFDLSHGTAVGAALGFYCANTLEALTGAWLVRRFVGERPSMATRREFFGAGLCTAGLSTMVGAMVGAATRVAFGMSHSFWASCQTWWCNEALAILLVMPFLLSWCAEPATPRRSLRRPATLFEAALLLACLIAGTWYMLADDSGMTVPCKFFPMPVLLWAALRFGMRGATAANLLVALFMGFLTSHHMMGLAPGQIFTGSCVANMQTFLAVSIVMSLVPAIVLNERNIKVEELRESEERFRNLTDASFEAICLTENGRVVDANDHGLKLMGYGRREVIGRNITDCIAPETQSLAAESIRLGKEGTFKHRIIRKDGTSFHAETRSKMVRLGNRMVRMTAMRDISDFVRAEEALRVSEEKFRSAMQHSPIGMGLVAPGGRWLEVNPALCKIVGYSEAELLATDFQTITHPDDLTSDEQCIRQMLARQIESYGVEKRYVHWDGHVIWAQLNVSLVRNPDGTPRHFVSQIQDISERKQAEEALQKNQAELVLAMDMARLFHWEYDVESRLITCDENLLKFYGTSAAEQGGITMPVNQYLQQFIHPGDASAIAAEIARGLSASDPNDTRQFEKRFRRRDGSTGTIMTRFICIRDASGRPARVYGINQDITDQKQAEQQQKKLEEQLRQAQKMEALGTLAGGTAHEFNNMLGIITGYAELAKTEVDEQHPVQTSLNEVLTAGQRAREIVQQILTFSRQQQQNREPLRMDLVVRAAIKSVRNTLPASVNIQLSIPESSTMVLGNPTQIHQVLMNICANAWHAMRQGSGTIKVTQQTVTLNQRAAEMHPNLRPEPYVHLSIADDGAGMSAETLARIFEPFFTTKGQGKGTGLGLAVVHGIMHAHDGVIFAQSKASSGTTFHLYFPVTVSNVNTANHTQARPPTPGSGQQILLVDDEPALRAVAAKSLRRSGYQTTESSSAAESLELVRNAPSRFDLIITDLTMPGMNGIELAAELFKLRPGLPVVLASGYGGEQESGNTYAPNVRSFLQKPFTMETLLQTVSQVLPGDGMIRPGS